MEPAGDEIAGPTYRVPRERATASAIAVQEPDDGAVPSGRARVRCDGARPLDEGASRDRPRPLEELPCEPIAVPVAEVPA